MVEINNQRKAFSLCWRGRRELITDVRKPEIMVMTSLWAKLFTDYSDHPRKLVTLNPKLKSTGAGRYQLLSRWWDAYRKAFGLKDFSPKSQDAVALQQIKERGALPMIDHWWYPSGNRPLQQYLGFTAGRWLWSVRTHKADSLIAKFKEAGGTVREIDVWAESPRLSPLWLSASSSACHGRYLISLPW